MSFGLYMDVHVRRAVTEGLRQRGVDVVTAQEDRSRQLSDPQLLDRATALNRVLFTHDDDLLVEGARRQRAGIFFAGLVYASQRDVTDHQCIDDLELMAQILEPSEMRNQIRYLPLRL